MLLSWGSIMGAQGSGRRDRGWAEASRGLFYPQGGSGPVPCAIAFRVRVCLGVGPGHRGTEVGWLLCVLAQSCPILGDPMSRLLCPWDFPGKNTGVGCHFLLLGIFPTQGSTHISCISCIGRWILYHCTPENFFPHPFIWLRGAEWSGHLPRVTWEEAKREFQ